MDTRDLCPVCGLDNGTSCTCWLCADCMTTTPHTLATCWGCGGDNHACLELENLCTSEVCRCGEGMQ